MEIGGSVGLVSGGASGLGLATARRLLGEGGQVVVIDLPSDGAEDAIAELGGGALFAPGDVISPEDVTRALDAAEQLGPMRFAVNCAGTGTSARTLGRDGPGPLDQFERLVQVNLTGTYNLARLAAERIARTEVIDGERGVIVNTASIAAYDGQIGQAAYAASKGGVASMTLPMARDLAVVKIRVCSIAPGLFRTPLLAGLPAEATAAVSATIPHPRRLGEPDEFARLVVGIITNPMLNGETIRLDGALRLN
jgi:NAD(P)-dependent dehydrogenase (short-subunit alcohol dehydrogenase family)